MYKRTFVSIIFFLSLSFIHIMTKESPSFLQVLGAGYGRTGTMSLRNALNMLG